MACNFCLYVCAFTIVLRITHGGVPPRCVRTQTCARTHPPADRDRASENMSHQAEKQAKISAFLKCSQGGEDDNTCSAASSSRCSFPTPSQSREKSPSAACPAPDKQQKSSHHRMTQLGSQRGNTPPGCLSDAVPVSHVRTPEFSSLNV
ncbi:hypothetical protein QQF64_014662 [Cirrhinus molitorella]|uniref:Secreted protein n=1 Tax=Cirrhinus molitorella TaxID=172907 RepID=A0ABR3NTG8_9TELE